MNALWSTIWYGKRHNPAWRFGNLQRKREHVLTVWGLMPVGHKGGRGGGRRSTNPTLQSELGRTARKVLSKPKRERKPPKFTKLGNVGRRGAMNDVCTLWFNCLPLHMQRTRKRYSGVPLVVRTVWGDLPLTDGRASVWFPGNEPVGDDPYLYMGTAW